MQSLELFAAACYCFNVRKKQPLSRHKMRGTQQAVGLFLRKYSWRHSEFLKKSLLKFILINEFFSKQLSSTTEPQTRLSCLKSALESYSSNSFDFQLNTTYRLLFSQNFAFLTCFFFMSSEHILKCFLICKILLHLIFQHLNEDISFV